MEVNKRFGISEDYSALTINIGAPSFAVRNNCKKLMFMNTVVALTTG